MKVKSIKTKVTLYVLYIVFFAIVISTFVSVIFTQRRLSAEEKKYLQSQSAKYAANIENWLVVEKTQAENMVYGIEYNGPDNKELTMGLLENFYQNSDELFDIFVGYEKDGDFVRANPDLKTPDGYDPRNRQWYQMAKETGQVVVTDPYVAAASQLMVTTIAAPIYENGKFVGALGIDVTLDVVISLTDAIHFEKDSYGFLLSENGDFVTHPNKDYLPSKLSKTNLMDVMPKLEKLIEPGNRNVFVEKNYEGEACFYASERIPICGWFLCITEYERNVKALIWNEIIYSIMAGVGCMVFVGFLMVWIISRQLAPVGRMIDVIKNLSDGYFDDALDRTSRQDELGTLQNSLANLIGILQIVIEEETYILGEVCSGNLDVEEMTEYPGQFNDLSLSVNAIPVTLSYLIKNIEEAAMNLESTIIAIETAESLEERQVLAGMLSTEVNTLMEQIQQFHTKDE